MLLGKRGRDHSTSCHLHPLAPGLICDLQRTARPLTIPAWLSDAFFVAIQQVDAGRQLPPMIAAFR